jgi:hypothetical protein
LQTSQIRGNVSCVPLVKVEIRHCSGDIRWRFLSHATIFSGELCGSPATNTRCPICVSAEPTNPRASSIPGKTSQNVASVVISDSGRFVPDEQLDALVDALMLFLKASTD